MSQLAWVFEHSTECKADKNFAWKFWTDVSNWEKLEGKKVEWIKLNGPFAEGTVGTTKMLGQEPHQWKISKLTPFETATIEMSLDGAIFSNVMQFKAIPNHETKITQRFTLEGVKASNFIEGMKMFEKNAPEGLLKLAQTIESVFNKT